MASEPGRFSRLRGELDKLSASQHGVFARWQVVQLGISESAIARRLSSGQWARPLPGVYRMAGAPETPEQRMASAALWAGPEAGVSHRTALHLWGIPCSFDQLDVLTAHRRDSRGG